MPLSFLYTQNNNILNSMLQDVIIAIFFEQVHTADVHICTFNIDVALGQEDSLLQMLILLTIYV